ncbi:MAG: hypothetical protein COV74_04585 [Candidatus Omnitrophica bacterium CG11_big_fil_rev_8_21_14_0_20_45_26]|uniref:Uncharacterized protein n=1 Tax=Candidatus Abzuiibacterium crystallinum TaxID=1974748 RepID=A0A2H0LQ30_9BACT|nr:MAG: hypothetical protein COV74_04585 [Candidatus Omnitrophica bacterium CG11_big_fil_rev_8_21_14_0_20_45_26]PIW64039.1 MAG: hypothetical protein COW12_07710 [Candidatus Omnitrophica bacterium CG12_big_fil_rev_8_21_14_0_65_45_16]
MIRKHLKRHTRQRGWTAIDLVATAAVASLVAVLSLPMYQQVRISSDLQALAISMNQIHKIMQDIYMDQNPNEYPPTNLWPDRLEDWAAPANLQNVQELIDVLRQLCREEDVPGGRGNYACFYEQKENGQNYDFVAQDGSKVGGSNAKALSAFTHANPYWTIEPYDEWTNHMSRMSGL